jgi:hypothetical protein
MEEETQRRQSGRCTRRWKSRRVSLANASPHMCGHASSTVYGKKRISPMDQNESVRPRELHRSPLHETKATIAMGAQVCVALGARSVRHEQHRQERPASSGRSL